MLPRPIPLHHHTRLDKLTQREEAGLTHYLRHAATPQERAAYHRATGPGTKAGTAPRNLEQLRALL